MFDSGQFDTPILDQSNDIDIIADSDQASVQISRHATQDMRSLKRRIPAEENLARREFKFQQYADGHQEIPREYRQLENMAKINGLREQIDDLENYAVHLKTTLDVRTIQVEELLNIITNQDQVIAKMSNIPTGPVRQGCWPGN